MKIGDLILGTEDLDTLLRLAESDGHSSQVFIADKNLVEKLMAIGWASSCHKDWLCGTKKLRTALSEIHAVLSATKFA